MSAALPINSRMRPDFEQENAFTDSGIHTGQILNALKANLRWILIPTLLAFLGSVIFVNVVSPRYTGEAKLLLESQDSFYTRPSQERDQQPLIDEQAVASQVQLVMSRDLAREAIKKLGLVGNPEFDPMVNEVGAFKRLLIMMGIASNPLDNSPEDRVLEQYYNRLLTYSVGKSRIVAIEFRSSNPELAARASNTIAELYLDFQEAAKKGTAKTASNWLGVNIQDLRQKLAEAETKVEEFRARTGLLMGSNNNTIASQQLSDLNGQLAQARSSFADSQAKARLIKDLIKSGRSFEIPDVANNELIRRLIEQRITLRTQLALELRTLLPGHPRIKELNAQLADMEAQIRGASERTVRTLENDAFIAKSRVETLQAALDTQKTLVGTANEDEVRLRALEREARSQRDQLESYLSRYREATARDVNNALPPDARIISRAVAPQVPSFPKKLPIVAIMTLTAFVLSSGLIVSRELLGQKNHGFDPDFDRQLYLQKETSVARGKMQEPSFVPSPVRPVASAEHQINVPEQRAEPSHMVSARMPPPAPAFSAVAASFPVTPSSEPEKKTDQNLNQSSENADSQDISLAEAIPSGLERLKLMTKVQKPSVNQGSQSRHYNYDSLVARVTKPLDEDRGRALLVTGLNLNEGMADLAKGLGQYLAKGSKTVLLQFDTPTGQASTTTGLTDLLNGQTAFGDVIGRDNESRLHVVEAGSASDVLTSQDWQQLDQVLDIFKHSYDWVIGLLHHPEDHQALSHLAPFTDAVILVSSAAPDDPDLVELYQQSQTAGSLDVLVVRGMSPVPVLEDA